MREPKKTVVNHLQFLEKQHGYLTPEMVVDDAMVPDSPLHGEFTWDKDTAAQAHWIEQARSLIRSVKVLITTETMTVKTVAYVRDPTKANNEQGYLSVERVRKDEDMARDALIEEFKRAGYALQRAQRLAIAFNIEDELNAMSKQLHKIRKDVEETVLSD